MSLNKQEIENFKARLEELRSKITQVVRGANESVKGADVGEGYSRPQADDGSDDVARNVSLEVSGKEVKILRQIERALEKINENTYGVCDVTEEEIPKARLEAVPYATMTVKAQEKIEKGLF